MTNTRRAQSRDELVRRKGTLLRMMGPTPSLCLDDPASGCALWVKLECLLPSGSTKDRIAAYILGHGVEAGTITPETVVVEASSGSTSIAFAMACAHLGLRFRAVMPEGVSSERMRIIQRYGGEVVLVSASSGVLGAIEASRCMAETDRHVFLPRQFENPKNVQAHARGSGPELIAQVGTTIHGFAAGVGTAGTLMGFAVALREAGHPVRVAQAIPDKASPCFAGQPEICGGIPGVVEGLSTLLDASAVDERITVPEEEAFAAARELCGRGLPVGPSSGLNFAAARRLAQMLGPGHTVATVLCDRMERYFTTELFRDLGCAPRM